MYLYFLWNPLYSKQASNMNEIFPGQSHNYMSWEFDTIYRHQNFF